MHTKTQGLCNFSVCFSIGQQLHHFSLVPRGSIIGPAPCFFAKLRDEYRWQIVIRHSDPASVARELRLGMNWRIDVDPLNLL